MFASNKAAQWGWFGGFHRAPWGKGGVRGPTGLQGCAVGRVGVEKKTCVQQREMKRSC
jgi:hypothetical protein